MACQRDFDSSSKCEEVEGEKLMNPIPITERLAMLNQRDRCRVDKGVECQ